MSAHRGWPVDPNQLRALSAALQRMADDVVASQQDGAAPREVTPALVRGVLRARRLRDRFFDPTLFNDPAWDMMLDLLLAKLEQRPVSVSGLCLAAAVPATTALRWIHQLTAAGVLVRRADDRDKRRVLIELSEEAEAAIRTYFETAVMVEDPAI